MNSLVELLVRIFRRVDRCRMNVLLKPLEIIFNEQTSLRRLFTPATERPS
jgi:hypothetical protein